MNLLVKQLGVRFAEILNSAPVVQANDNCHIK